MRRLHLFELHEMAGFPKGWRELLTDFLSFYAARFRPYEESATLLAEALRTSGGRRVIDLCSGAGQPVISLIPALHENGAPDLEIVLTDKFPHVAAWACLGDRNGVTVSYEAEPVDALAVPDHLTGFRTIFTSFHHFTPGKARAVFADAVRQRQGIAVFEYTERNLWLWSVPLLSIPFLVLFCTPFIRPFRWRRLLWTYLLPVVPLVALWDGFVSCLRTYSVDELRALTEEVADTTYRWTVGRIGSLWPTRVTFAIGFPAPGIGPPAPAGSGRDAGRV